MRSRGELIRVRYQTGRKHTRAGSEEVSISK